MGAGASLVAGVGLLLWSLPGLIASGEWTYLVSVGLVLLAWIVWQSANRMRSSVRFILRLLGALLLLSGAAFFFFVDFTRMWELGDERLFKSIIRTIFYSAGTVPIQLSISLVLAYVLFQNIKGKGFFRLVYFLPYIAPTVATSATPGTVCNSYFRNQSWIERSSARSWPPPRSTSAYS
mgnify:CR=1 FL=1